MTGKREVTAGRDAKLKIDSPFEDAIRAALQVKPPEKPKKKPPTKKKDEPQRGG